MRRKYSPLIQTFTPPKNSSHDKNTYKLTNVLKKTAIDKNAPEGFSIDNRKKRDSEIMPEFSFTETPGFKVEIPDDSNKLYFLKLIVDEIFASLSLQTNKYATDFIQASAQKLGECSRFSKWAIMG